MTKVFGAAKAPSTYGTFLRSPTFGHVRQLDAVHSRTLAGLAKITPRLLAGTDAMAFLDVDDTIREVHGYAKQGAAYGYSGVKGLNAQIAVLSSPVRAGDRRIPTLQRQHHQRARRGTSDRGRRRDLPRCGGHRAGDGSGRTRGTTAVT